MMMMIMTIHLHARFHWTQITKWLLPEIIQLTFHGDAAAGVDDLDGDGDDNSEKNVWENKKTLSIKYNVILRKQLAGDRVA